MTDRKFPRTLSIITACIVAGVAGPASAQYQALVEGETIISIGPAISPVHASPRPGCTVDCERAARGHAAIQSNTVIGESVLLPPANNHRLEIARDTAANATEAQLREAGEQLREARLTFTHDMNQATQRIDHLSQLLKLCQQQVATESNAHAEVEALAKSLKVLESKNNLLVTERDRIAKEASEKVRLSQKQQKAVQAMLGKTQTEVSERTKSLEAELHKRAQRIATLEKQLSTLRVELSKTNPDTKTLEEKIKVMEAEHKKALAIKGDAFRDAVARRIREVEKRAIQSEAKKFASKLKSIESSLQTELAKQKSDTKKVLEAACDRVKLAMEKLAKSEQSRKKLEKEVTDLKGQLKDCEDQIRESSKKKRPKKGGKKN